MDTAPVSWPATAPVMVSGLVEGLWQAGKTEWFKVAIVEVRMEMVRTFLLSCPIHIQLDGRKKGGWKATFLGGAARALPSSRFGSGGGVSYS